MAQLAAQALELQQAPEQEQEQVQVRKQVRAREARQVRGRRESTPVAQRLADRPAWEWQKAVPREAPRQCQPQAAERQPEFLAVEVEWLPLLQPLMRR